MKSKNRSFYMAGQLLLVLTFAVAGAGKQTQPTAEEQFTPLIRSIDGRICSGPIALRATGWMPKERVRPPER